MSFSTRLLTVSALFAALIAVLSQIQIPLVIPINMALLAVYLVAALMPFPYSLIAVLVYVSMGAIGLPVFAGFQGGAAVLFGRTGGYILGYLFCALIISLFKGQETAPFYRLPLVSFIGTLVLYAFGTLWYMHLTGTALYLSLTYCVFPFIPGDLAKIALATVLVRKLRPALRLILHS